MRWDDDTHATAAMRRAQLRMNDFRRWYRHAPEACRTLIVNEKVDTAWNLLMEARRDLRRLREEKRAPLKTGRYAR